ncbi:glycoside hydrolase family 16 protein [Collybiopsis luxurians FD-317 M1]|nr:glycoside hydrolase family 16 protein [Collybiopsis luxurians FD-317 M1]
MSNPPSSRRAPQQQGPSQYAAVPQSPRSSALPYNPQRPAPPGSRSSHQGTAIAQGVASGAIGGGYGPYSYNPNPARDAALYSNSRFSAAPSEHSASSISAGAEKAAVLANTATVPQYLWDKDPELDDALHNPDPVRDAKLDRSFTVFSARGWLNAGALVLLILALLTLFAGYPIINNFAHPQAAITGFNLGGINGTGQIPDLPSVPSLIDADTPSSARTRTGTDGKSYNLVFSDEFNKEGRTFYPGDDPYWEGVDLHYWPTGDLEWYDPGAITTKGGQLVITLTEENNHDLNFKSGMLQSWNKLCFMTGYIEVSISLPGTHQSPGFWPGAWTMGNLGRAGYGATTEGTWPYSYDSCDLGTYPNQTNKAGTGPEGALQGTKDGNPISYLPGQRWSACTCPGGDHPGPDVGTGRGVPEIDIIEAQIDVSNDFKGQVSQSYQIAPFNYHYQIDNSSTTLYDTTLTEFNSYQGGTYQQAASALTYIPDTGYSNQSFIKYGFEWWSNPSNRDEGYITWFSNGKESWTLPAAAIGADSTTEISARLIPEEPMYMILNLGMSPNFQAQDYEHMQFPAQMLVDYVRVYQRAGTKDVLTCDPSTRPTASYINDHITAYSDANLTTWGQAGYTFPRNSQYDGC